MMEKIWLKSSFAELKSYCGLLKSEIKSHPQDFSETPCLHDGKESLESEEEKETYEQVLRKTFKSRQKGKSWERLKTASRIQNQDMTECLTAWWVQGRDTENLEIEKNYAFWTSAVRQHIPERQQSMPEPLCAPRALSFHTPLPPPQL